MREIIAEELRQWLDFYSMQNAGFDSLLGSELLNDYVEIVLAKDRMELVLGGMGREEELLRLAADHGFDERLRNLYAAAALQFPGKMLYTKFGGKDAAGSMYFVLLEPWSVVTDFLGKKGFSQAVLDQLMDAVGDRKICFLLGFSFDPKQGQLTVKAYHLYDYQSDVTERQPFLVSFRFTQERFDPQPKIYYAKATWEDFAAKEGWGEIAAKGASMFGNQYGMLHGVGEDKAYVFRHDKRVLDILALKSYNYYVEEGNSLISAGFLADAEKAFRNAIAYDPADVDAWNRLGYSVLMQGRYVEGIRFVRKAHSMNPNITNLIWIWANPLAEQDAEIARLTEYIASDPQPQWYNGRAIYKFHMRRYDEAKEDLLKAIELEPIYAEAHNNLAGVYIKKGEFISAVRHCTIAFSITNQVNSSNLTTAREALRLIKAAEDEPSQFNYNALGKYYYQLDLFEDAERCFLKATEYLPVSV